jgi:hypothetical protein
MKVSQVFSGEYLKASDLQGAEHSVVIADVQRKEFDDGDKLLITFQNRKKSLVANKTNSNTISDAYGDDTDDWIGKEIVLYSTMVDFQGKRTPAIRVRPPAPRKPISQQATPSPKVNPPPANGASADMNDEIPFGPEWR